mmetsp:Transcript_7256/g.20453  ORF Transcript_7256/g.20453 Transcript_7256/m.20453 type:complete len:670 (+) Transcript_7256:350-2359(+)|eukprot:CAMPEP_0117681604 /NCGR_PEP_ID=MMETSP0804-20121206/19085_1 /TAXON_ID=1074897 /ORGANISM="Tetraselmis astigmatica, Strain CCMP880" /LENGTH=669 /DNA_ID=CAMNT_0005491401 /DNA_START=275 /DNA_END=2284 /DNA_ORIENTATION=-
MPVGRRQVHFRSVPRNGSVSSGGPGSWWSPDIMQRRKRLALAAIVLLVLLTLLSAAELTAAKMATYVIVIDSGSTGTRVYVYKWEDRPGSTPRVTPLEPSMEEVMAHRKAAGFNYGAYKRIETEPGLDKAAGDAAAVRAALLPLLDWAKKTIPVPNHPSSPVFLFGTAGLRKLPDEQRASLLADVQHILDASPFRFEPDWVKVIAGSDEGIYGWVGLNFIHDLLRPPEALDHPIRQPPTREAEGADTVGSLDLGGSSLEVTFVAENWPAKTDMVDTAVLGSQYSVYTHSYKGYGMNDAFDRGVTILLEAHLSGDSGKAAADSPGSQLPPSLSAQQPAEPPVLPHPCLQNGYSRTYQRKDPHWRPRNDAEAGRGPAPDSALAAVEEVRLVGGPDWQKCRRLAWQVVDPEAPCGHPPCTLGVMSPVSRGRYYAMAGFFVVYDFFKLQLSATLQDLEDAGRQYCGREWQAVEAEKSGIKNIDAYCFRAPFVSILLQEGLGVLPSRVSIVEGGFSWTLGATIAEGANLAGLGGLPDGSLPLAALRPSRSWTLPASANMLFVAVLVLAWAVLLGAAIYQHGEALWRPWTRGLQLDGSPMKREGSGLLGRRSPARRQHSREVLEVHIPVQTGIKAMSSPPPLREAAEFYKARDQGRRRLDRSSDCLQVLSDTPEV